ncbi:MAG: hypothetical protein GQ524_10285 [Anaerolineales bacterium]|nr:hypothetical protein [Anaerolineales bacterium]
MSNQHQPRNASSKLQRGQAMVLIALAFIGLAAFVGLTVDAGILFIQIGHLRRAVDSASLAAANQFREGRTLAEIEAAADEFINLNNLNPANAVIYICDIADPTAGNSNVYHDVDICPPDIDGNGVHDDSPPRKFVRVEATMPVEFAFLPIIGWGSIDIQAEAISETASVDLVLVIDTSQSMAWDAVCGDGIDDDAWAEINLPGGLGFADGVDDCTIDGTVLKDGGFEDDYMSDPNNCNDVDVAAGVQGECYPFEDVRAAALALVDRMYFPYDRMAVISFDVNAIAQLHFSDSPSSIKSSIGSLLVYKLPGCPGWSASKDPTGCTNTNIADGLKVGGNEFGLSLRQEAVPILILLSDGAANAATDNAGNFVCPQGPANMPTWVEPFCRDEDFEIGPGAYGAPDTEDMAVDRGYFVGCPDANAYDPLLTSCTGPGQGAVMFTIGLGEELINNTDCHAATYPGGCQPNQGEELLRFLAAIGDDADPSTDPCSGEPIGQSCGNYYYAPTGTGLIQVFEAIASRIFTRIVH